MNTLRALNQMQAVYSRVVTRFCVRSLVHDYNVRELHQSSRAQSPNKIVLDRNYFHKVYSTIVRKMSSTGPIYTVEYLSNKLKNDLQAEHVEMEDLSNCGCGMKFDAVIVSPQFEGKPLIQRQRLVNQALSEEMKHIHAFTMRTLTPIQWEEALKQRNHGSN